MEHKTVIKNWDGIRRIFLTDDAEPGMRHFHSEQDIGPIIDSIKRDQEIMAQNGDAVLSHRIPAVIYDELQRKGIADDPDEFRKWLNGPEGRSWKVWKGSV